MGAAVGTGQRRAARIEAATRHTRTAALRAAPTRRSAGGPRATRRSRRAAPAAEPRAVPRARRPRFRDALLCIALLGALFLATVSRMMLKTFAQAGIEHSEPTGAWAARIRRHCPTLGLTGVRHRVHWITDQWLDPAAIDRRRSGWFHRGHWPDTVYYTIMCAEHFRYIGGVGRMPATGPELCAGFRAFGRLPGWEAKLKFGCCAFSQIFRNFRRRQLRCRLVGRASHGAFQRSC